MDRHHAIQMVLARAGSNVIPNHRHLGRLEFDEDNVHIPEDPGAWEIFPSVIMMASLAVLVGLLFWVGILLFKRKDMITKKVQGSFAATSIERNEEDADDSSDDSPLLDYRKI
ncbi:unnamed protein product [Meganyctiphanes norvegica]|uniref:Uncharacterized protein n=1 Tax=Meganyctiphanes norvegica TaxID=48144 RepID=A0AAV2QLA2_MEGNR